ncbi:sigma-70 family RNA polymerase sigma factor [Nocardioides sp. SYSU D00038]|uniref:sigma-70 family RNA polymerase sigma factor n=1 Tax=Nocardioides sp. SYSU D00038 TaxID=2812554 RepID=UPI0019673C5E|nr:sigma-70 family RNA polymerase sigma factor [Nocardioides sp. SYSU D00038]
MDTTAAAPSREAERAAREHETARLFAAASQCQGSEREALLRRIVEINTCVAHAVAHRYRNRDVAMEDLEQVACVALVAAARRFDPDRSENFLTYAVPTIAGEVRRYFRDHGWVVRPPRSLQEARARVSAVRDTLPPGDDGRPASHVDIAQVTDLSEAQVAEALRLDSCFSPLSLDLHGQDGDGVALGSMIASDDDGVSRAEARVLLQPAMATLTERQRQVLQLRFGQGLHQREIGEIIGVSQVQVSRLLSQALGTLRTALGAESYAEVA